jgi:CheY-like chemotaxis protein/GGDEF domain-containing protein
MSKDILIVEDDPITRRYLELGLKRLGFVDLRAAASSDEAIALVKERVPDLALMDIQLDGRDGIETARILGSQFGVPVIFLTACADEVTVARAKQVNPLGYLVKPVKAEDLRSTMAVALHKHQTQRETEARERALITVLDALHEPIIGCDSKGVITFANEPAASLVGTQIQALQGQSLAGAMPLKDLSGNALLLNVNKSARDIDAQIVLPAGAKRLQVTVICPESDVDAAGCSLVWLRSEANSDVQPDMRRLQAQLDAQSITDDATGLVNLRGFNLVGEPQLRLARRLHATMSIVRVVVRDLQNIKTNFGVTAIQQAMSATVAVLRSAFPDGETAGRIGDDEFAVLAIGNDPQIVAKRITACCDAFNATSGNAFTLNLHIGTVISLPKENRTVPELIALMRAQSENKVLVIKTVRPHASRKRPR